MGLIKAAIGAVGSTLHDQWKEYIKCEDLGKYYEDIRYNFNYYVCHLFYLYNNSIIDESY